MQYGGGGADPAGKDHPIGRAGRKRTAGESARRVNISPATDRRGGLGFAVAVLLGRRLSA